ncbi:MAG TPA: adenylate/guanylate cyclase domain-containing protein [Candidatus Dormibacteraeota bacterium]
MICPNCQAENRAGRKFCAQCGAALAQACPACGAATDDDSRFCGECGVALGPALVAPASEPAPEPTTERRLVSVLFADLVGFTAVAEGRDPEDVRELLSAYFERATQVIQNYGGTVEKFIGDAVMAVWGAPVAQEDDPERAVRAALELVAAVGQLPQDSGPSGLTCRAGVLTGEAAVNLGARGQGMVAGELVNMASRIQATAAPGTVFVGESTMRSTRASIVYEASGEHAMKGISEPVAVWRALRVVSGIRGALRSSGLEAPFVGRDRELRLVKELLAAVAEEHRAHLLSVTGVAGIGKTRLAWELFKYVDGLSEGIWWHRGRCLSYGEGVTYWALAEMVRMRAGIEEGDDPATARQKLASVVELHLPEPEERRWVESRLADLLGLHQLPTREATDLFAAWRLFFERLSDANTTILVFEDLQWADSALLDFITYLIDWSRNHRLFIVTLARPELSERRPDWGAGRRAATALYLEPLGPKRMEALLDGLVPGLPSRVRDQIRVQAEGIPLYAVETVRMLLDRGVLLQEGDVYRPVGAIEDLEVPESLQGLIAARLDGLSPEERALLQTAAVVGKAFTAASLAQLSGGKEEELEPLLSALVRKEILGIQTDPRAPERGQYTFLQDLVRRVAYGTLARAERRSRHLRAAELLEASRAAGEEEMLEIIASHLREAYQAAPDAADAPEIRRRAGRALAGAGRRAASLGASPEAERFLAEAASLAESPAAAAQLEEEAGMMALQANRLDAAGEHWQRAADGYLASLAPREAARVEVRRAEIDWRTGQVETALARTQAAYRQLSDGPDDADLARAAAQLARWHVLATNFDLAAAPLERALELSGAFDLPEVLAESLNTKALALRHASRREEAIVGLQGAVALALARDLPSAALRAANNLLELLIQFDRHGDALSLSEQFLALSRRVGDRLYEVAFLGDQVRSRFVLGEWDQALQQGSLMLTRDRDVEQQFEDISFALTAMVPIHLARGQLAQADAVIEQFRDHETAPHPILRYQLAVGEAKLLAARGQWSDSLAAARRALAESARVIEETSEDTPAMVDAIEAAFATGDLDWVGERLGQLDRLRPGQLRPSLKAHRARLQARLDGQGGDLSAAQAGYAQAAQRFRELRHPFPLATTLVEAAELLRDRAKVERAAELVGEALPILVRLRAEPWVERARLAGRPASASAHQVAS